MTKKEKIMREALVWLAEFAKPSVCADVAKDALRACRARKERKA